MRALRRGEAVFVAAMFTYFFLVITTFWILKPVKKTLFISFYDQAGITMPMGHRTAAQAELVAKVLNMVVAAVAAAAFAWTSRARKRQRLTYALTGFVMAGFVAFHLLTRSPGHATVWTFYLFGDLYSTLMVAGFFAFLNDSVQPEASKRLYGPIISGGVVGGVVGSTTVAAWIDRVSTSGWLLICLALGVATLGAAAVAGARAEPPPPSPPAVPPAPRPRRLGLDGARRVFASPYLLAILAVVGLYEIASTLLDFMFTSAVAFHLSGPAIGRHFARVFSVTNWLSLVVQLFLTRLVMTRLGVGAALAVLPAAIVTAAGGFVALPTLWMGSLLNTADNALSYSINQSAKEALYVPLEREEKYQAKSFIDMFGQRFAKTVAVLLGLWVTTEFRDFSAIRSLGLAVVVLGATWMWAVRHAGREYDRRTRPAPTELARVARAMSAP